MTDSEARKLMLRVEMLEAVMTAFLLATNPRKMLIGMLEEMSSMETSNLAYRSAASCVREVLKD
jgi:hypothetical protein